MHGPGVTLPDHPKWRVREVGETEQTFLAKPFLKASRTQPSGEQQEKQRLVQAIMAKLELET